MAVRGGDAADPSVPARGGVAIGKARDEEATVGGPDAPTKKRSIRRAVVLGGVVAVVLAVGGRNLEGARAREAAVEQLVQAFSGALKETVMMVFSMALAVVEA